MILERMANKPRPHKQRHITVKELPEVGVPIVDERGKHDEISRSEILENLKKNYFPDKSEDTKPVSQRKVKVSKSRVIKLMTRINIVEPVGETCADVPEKSTRKRNTERPKMDVIAELQEGDLVHGEEISRDRLPVKQKQVLIKTSHYYMNNRELFVNFMNGLLRPYQDDATQDAKNVSCSQRGIANVELLTHQKIVRDYLNLYTPYRGLLLYHGLGSGKTCTSIAIAEGLKSERPVIVFTPASLEANYMSELKKCGDVLYKKNQHWEFIATNGNSELENELSKILSLPIRYIRENRGAWLVHTKKPSNYDALSSDDKIKLDLQINKMIRTKYEFRHYNGMRMNDLHSMTKNWSVNPFDNKTVIIDEAHNFVSRIVNKLKKPDALSSRLYHYLLNAESVRIVMLTGTPIINYPNEIAVAFNILRGYIKTFTFTLDVKTKVKVNETMLKSLFKTTPILKDIVDFVSYKPSTKTLVVMRNPYGFVSGDDTGEMSGVEVSVRGEISNDEFVAAIKSVLEKENVAVTDMDTSDLPYKALPDNLDEFKKNFIKSDGSLQNENLFKRRILGLTSYFRSAQEQLMPRFDVNKHLHIISIEMSSYQFGIYEDARKSEREQEKNNAKKRLGKVPEDIYNDSVSTYRIFSRLYCNFVFPRTMKRPLPKLDDDVENLLKSNAVVDEAAMDAMPADEYALKEDADGISEIDATYENRIEQALNDLEANASELLTPEMLKTYSPKFLNILENINDKTFEGLHLVYSNFRTLEGIGIFKIVLEANGFAQFKIKKSNNIWQLDMEKDDFKKPVFALYTGTETTEEKEIIRNIYNGTWENVPATLASHLKTINNNNTLGDLIKVLMITQSGAEGITLKNCRYVHIMEPYWHPVRIEQVIGRARRICSHQELPEALRTVDVFLYLMTFSKEQLETDASIELRLKDKSKLDNKRILTSDEALFEVANIKQDINKNILKAVKETAIDCAIHKSSENIVCYSFGNPNETKYAYYPSLKDEQKDDISKINQEKISWKAKEIKIKGKLFALKTDTSEVYDYDSYVQAVQAPGQNPTLIGKLEKIGDKTRFVEL